MESGNQTDHCRQPPALLAALDGAHADVRCIKDIVYRYVKELDQRLPLAHILGSKVCEPWTL
jgi:hypothetical protein